MIDFINSPFVTIILCIFCFLGALITTEREGFFRTLAFFLTLVFCYAYAYNSVDGKEHVGLLAFFIFFVPVTIKFGYNIIKYSQEG